METEINDKKECGNCKSHSNECFNVAHNNKAFHHCDAIELLWGNPEKAFIVDGINYRGVKCMLVMIFTVQNGRRGYND